jgi:SAM-dependent methyltransferase
MKSQEGRSDAYAHFAEQYDSIIGSEYYPRLLARFEGVAQRMAAGSRHLDVGCGTGALLEHSVSLGLNVQGVDISPKMVAIAKERRPGLRVDCGDLTDLGGERWNLITANNDVLNHLVQAHGLCAVFVRFSELLEPHGVVLADAVSDYDIRYHWEGCTHLYTDQHTFRCEVSHEVLDESVPSGMMRRRWFRHDGEGWQESEVEEEVLPGISVSELEEAAGQAGLSLEVFDWDLGGPCEAATSRIGIMLRAPGMRAGSDQVLR